jgi:replicative DNA helicase
MFHDEKNRCIWLLMVKAQSINHLFSETTIIHHFELIKNNDLVYYVRSLRTAGENPHMFKNYCLKLNEFWIQRSLFQYGYHVNVNALRVDIDALDLLGEASYTLGKIFLHIAKMSETSMADAVKDLAQQIHDIGKAENGIIGLLSSINGLNKTIRGYRKGNLIVVGASTHEGKTTLAVQETRHFIEQNIPVGYISLEMSQSELLLMMSCDACNVDMGDILDNIASQQQIHSVSLYMERIKKMPLYMTDKAGLRIGEIRAIARMWNKNNNIKILFVDHMHLAYDDIEQSTAEQRYTNIANKLKELAKELNIPVVALAQLARKDQGDRSKPHEMHHLKYAGGIEQSADIVILIYRPELHGIDRFPDGGSTAGYAKLIIAKLRLLKKANVTCRFMGTRFNDWEEMYQSSTPSAGFDHDKQRDRILGEKDSPLPF